MENKRKSENDFYELEKGKELVEKLNDIKSGVFMRLRFDVIDVQKYDEKINKWVFDIMCQRLNVISRTSDIHIKIDDNEIGMFFPTDEENTLIKSKCIAIIEWVTKNIIYQEQLVELYCVLGYCKCEISEKFDDLFNRANPAEAWHSGNEFMPKFIENQIKQDKKKIMIVDDSDINRIVLKKILGDLYEIDEIESGRAAIEKLKISGSQYSLVLLDNYMPGMSGIDVLEEMSKNNWLSGLPVIMISTDRDDDLVNRAYELGASDFLFKPFTYAIVLRRVQYIIELYNRHHNDIDSTLTVLSDLFHVIMQIDLNNDTCKVIRNMNTENMWKYGISSKASEVVKLYNTSDLIFEEDKKSFLAFFDLSNLKAQFDSGLTHIDFHYRRKDKGVYRWTLLEATASRYYSDDNAVVIVSSRDVHDTYMTQRREYNYLTNNAIAAFYGNITRNTVLRDNSEFLEKYSGKLFTSVSEKIIWQSKFIPDEMKRREFVETFISENLLREYRSGKNQVEFEYVYEKEKGIFELLKTTVYLSQNSKTKDIEALFCTENISDKYVKRKVEKLLYDKEYTFIGVIDTTAKTLTIHKSFYEEGEYSKKQSVPYDKAFQYDLDNYVTKESKKSFERLAQLDNIIAQLEKKEIFEFTVNRKNDDGKTVSNKQVYRYFDYEYGIILCMFSDITESENRDSVTGKLNSLGFEREVRDYILKNDSRQYAMLYFDIKEFKALNEIFGFEEGNDILKHISEHILKSNLKPIFLGRMMADHFSCLVERDNLDFSEVARVCHKKITINDNPIHIRMECGVYYIDNINDSIRSMCDRAKIAEKYIENEYSMPYVVYKNSMNDDYIHRTNVLNNVFDALSNKEFKVYYQPIVDAKTREIVSAEALVRWITKSGEIISPGVFIPVLEEKGLISRVDLYMAGSTHFFLLNRKEQNKKIVPVSMNLSRMDFLDNEMIDTLLDMVKNTNLKTRYLRFEVTESAYIDIGWKSEDVLEKLQGMGAQILIDDFGSGYSSLGSLSEQKFDIIKMDMSFVKSIGKNKNTEAIIVSIIEMVHRMDAKVIAEGVETEEQYIFLRDNNCDYIQGYYFSKPLPEKEFAAMLDVLSVSLMH